MNGREAARSRLWPLQRVGQEGRKITSLRGPCGRRTLHWFLLALGLQIACGGQAVVKDDGGTGGVAATGGGGPTGGSGGESATGGAPLASGGVTGTGGVADNGCSMDTIECDQRCSCEGVFAECPYTSIHCDVDGGGEPYNCVCGTPPVLVSDCEYGLQYRCEPPGVIAWLSTCTCDPVLPTDDEPCRYYQAMYDALGEDRTCIMAVTDIEPMEKSKYQCSCLPDLP